LFVEALKLHCLGYCVFPARAKLPAVRWKPLQLRRPTPRWLRRAFGRRGIDGVAAVTGFGGLGVRDWDDVAAYRRWAAAHPGLASELPTVRTARGYQVHFRLRRPLYLSHARLGDGELIGDRRHYVVVPPSRHPAGVRYAWVTPPVGHLPLVDPAAAGLVPADTCWSPARAQPPGPEQKVPRTPSTDCVPPGPGGAGADPLSPEAVAAVRRTLPSGPGQRRNRLFDLAGALKAAPSLVGLPADDLLPVVRSWFRAALPVVRTKDWATTWRDFRDAWANYRPELRAGYLAGVLERARTPPAPDPASLLAGVCRELQRDHGGRPFPLAVRTAADLLDVSKSTAGRLLGRLRAAGALALVKEGCYATGYAHEYRYTPGAAEVIVHDRKAHDQSLCA
jgi:hypothetical protein